MTIPIIKVALSKNPVSTKEPVLISITVVTYRYLKDYTHAQLGTKTHAQIADGGME